MAIGRFVDAESHGATRYVLAWVTCPYCETRQLIEVGGVCPNCHKGWFRLIAMWNPLDSQPLDSEENIVVTKQHGNEKVS